MNLEPRILIAGIGNIFKGDDGFGVEVASRLSNRDHESFVEIADFGIRGLDLAYALLENRHDLVILLDIAQRGGPPGSLYLITPDLNDAEAGSSDAILAETHGLHPDRVLKFCFELCAKGTSIEGAELQIAEVAATGRCANCQRELESRNPLGICPCGSAEIGWIRGRELKIRELDVF